MSSKSGDVDEFEDAPVEILPKEVRLADDADDTLPNTLVITVLQARHLQPSAFRDTLSCYVKLSSLGVEYKTSVMTKTREPRWHEVFAFRAVDWTTGVTVSVRDRLPLKMHFIGQIVISSAEIASLPGMTTQRWFQLRDKGVTGQLTGAELELKAALVYTKANDQELFQAGSAAAELEHGAVDAGLADLLVGQEDETEEEVDARARALLRREEQEREAAAAVASLKQGDYQVQVHIIEARDLKGENLSGTSDPYCQVDIMGVSKKTSTKYDTLGCVFDEILFFNFPNIGRHELREASIKISVYDKEQVLRDNLIGIYQLDCLSVYAQPHHELYRQWIAVHDNLSTKDRGIQGFLLVSVVLLGPGDALRVHDREAEVEQELAETTGEQLPEDSDQRSIPPLVLVPPAIELKLQFLTVKVLRAEHLPAMDTGGLLIGAQGIDAFVQVVFAANAPCKTSVVTVKGRGNLAPDFYEELWLPEEERAKQEYLELRRLQDGPQRVVVRVYMLRGQNLQAKNANGYSDPYLRLKLGSNRINDRPNACTNTLKPEFFRMFELETTLPGASQLDINVWDRGLVTDQLIGSTTIDLEERWFHREWQEIEQGNSFDSSSEDEKDTAVKLAPREDNALLGQQKPKKSSQKRFQKRREPSLAERKQQKEEADAEAALNGLLDFMGLGRLPDDAEWIPIHFTDREAAVSMEMGRIGISVQIVPEEEALASPVGKGQNAPNLNPYLPPPVGRMRFTANPIAMLKVEGSQAVAEPPIQLFMPFVHWLSGALIYSQSFLEEPSAAMRRWERTFTSYVTDLYLHLEFENVTCNLLKAWLTTWITSNIARGQDELQLIALLPSQVALFRRLGLTPYRAHTDENPTGLEQATELVVSTLSTLELVELSASSDFVRFSNLQDIEPFLEELEKFLSRPQLQIPADLEAESQLFLQRVKNVLESDDSAVNIGNAASLALDVTDMDAFFQYWADEMLLKYDYLDRERRLKVDR
ncbi:hypothetical protein JG687_00003720 [Phytophthora cactorum]|uniref:C2 domain-containing protein n=1 Tax=Phytophthora cactorum TaxID=29920 RepID=A0A8T1UTA8_9STRA|nr:hypothetical protein JG687_00003720 [Phytophthora cactorum]